MLNDETQTPTIDEDTLLAKAFRRWRRDCEAAGAAPTQPANYSYVEGDVAVLVNCNGELARYRWDGRKLIEVGIEEPEGEDE